MEDLPFQSALRLADLIRQGEISPVEITRLYLERIDKHNPTLNAFVTVLEDAALQRAERAESLLKSGDELPPFHGVPLPIKDLMETAGVKTTFSSRAYADFVPDKDAAVVARLKRAGFIVLGKTNASEFGTWPVTESDLNGACRNPWNPELTSGGSSGGAGAAVAAGLAPAAQGSDGGGSIRIPASCCGVYGIKPSRGRVSHGPQLGEFWAGFSTSGPLTRSVADAAALLDVISGYEPGDPYWAPPHERSFVEETGRDAGRLRVGLLTRAITDVPVDQKVLDATEDAARLLESLGHSVEPMESDWVDPDITSHFIKVVQSSTAYHEGLDLEKIETGNRALAEAAEGTSSLTYIRALRELQGFTRRVISLWREIDVLLTPTLALPPVKVGWMFEEPDPWAQLIRAGMFMPFTPLANITGQPAASVPLYWTADEIPIGVQLVGPPAGEAVLFRLSAQLEEARPWAHRRPPIS
ncbi:MAG: amidase [Actinomycetota bacterium]|nr:amidase [Actinomycetota bacterium]